jgi:hypothetical protein
MTYGTRLIMAGREWTMANKPRERTDALAAETQQTQLLAEPYKPTPAENAALAALLERRQRIKPLPRLRITQRQGEARPSVEPDHVDTEVGRYLVMESLGVCQKDLVDALIRQIFGISKEGLDQERDLNNNIATLQGIGPTNAIECLLALQMVAVHSATMEFAGRLQRAENPDRRESLERSITRLSRAFIAQAEGLKHLRSTASQVVRVERVVVKNGAQAIVGNVTPGVGRGLSDGK